ncbi:MAG: hypothetical protein HWD58_22215 [Bacteroidota bacterium]|nr:MAG: hypothetical protein HWD58_22215 [Bacteroidota bacterium]
MGMTTQNDATNYINQPIVIHVLIEGFSFKILLQIGFKGHIPDSLIGL